LTAGSHSSSPPNKTVAATRPTTHVSSTTTMAAPTTITTAAPTTATAPSSAVLSCGPGSTPNMRPTLIYIGCADGAISLTKITWSAWGSTSGSGSGTLNENDCTPDCADGTFHSAPASVVVSNPVGGVFQDVSIIPNSGGLSPEASNQPGSGWGGSAG
jgi:hypothetical protein